MKASENCINLIKQFEGFYEDAYLCPAGIPTIGYGSIRWADGKPVKLGEHINFTTAEKLLYSEVNKSIIFLKDLDLNQNQIDACLSFIYNLGGNNFKYSTLYKKIKRNPDDEAIVNEFMRWNKARVNGQLIELKGLTRRRKAESELYFKKIM